MKVLADALYSPGENPAFFMGTVATLLQTPTHNRRELAETWIRLDSTDSSGNPHVVVTCPDCFRTFPLTVAPVASLEVLTVPCLFCSYEVRYANDFTRL